MTTVEFAVNAFLLSHLRFLSKYFDVVVLVNTTDESFLKRQGIDVRVIPIKISRKISLLNDLQSLYKLTLLFLKERPTSVHSITPKAGFLVMLAGVISRVPVRIHTFTGQVWCNSKGFFAWELKLIDKLTALFATHLIIDSPSQRDFLLEAGVINQNKAILFGKGSVSGVDLKKFKSNQKTRSLIRSKLLIPLDAFLFIFVGRITQDKGVLDLADAFVKLNQPEVYLLILGPDEEGLLAQIKYRLGTLGDRLRVVGYTREVGDYLTAADVLCLPSYREGFGSSVIEAAAMGIPAIGSDIYGLRDAIDDEVTGLLHPPHDIALIAQHMQTLMQDTKLYKRLSSQAAKRTRQYFDQKDFSQMWLNFYLDRMAELSDKRH